MQNSLWQPHRLVFQNNPQGGPQSAPTVSDAELEEADVQDNELRLNNADAIVRSMERLHLQQEDGGTDNNSLAEYLRRPLDSESRLMDLDVRVTVIDIIQRQETGNPLMDEHISDVRAVFERQLTQQRNGQEVTPAPAEEEMYLAMLENLKEIYQVIIDTNTEQDRTATEVLGGGMNRALLNFNLNTTGPQKTAILAGVAGTFLWIYTGQGRTAKALKAVINGTIVLGAGTYLANALTTAVTGEGILPAINRLNRRNNPALGHFFDLNLDETEDEETLEQLLDSVVHDPVMRSRSFSQIVSAYSETSDSMPSYITNGTNISTQEESIRFHRAMGLIINKFGPTSDAYRDYPEVRAEWDYAMDNPEVGLQQAFFRLWGAHPDSPELHMTHTETAKDFIVERAQAFASPIITWSDRGLRAASEGIGGHGQGFMEAVRRMLPGGTIEDGQLANFINRQIDSPDQMTGLDGNYGRFAYAALKTNNPNRVFEDGTGVAYTTATVPLSEADFANEALRHARIASAYVEAFDHFEDEYGYEANMADHINILFGAEHRVAGSGGTYYVAFTYNSPDSLSREHSELAPRNLDTRYSFSINNFTPTDKAFAMAFYQTDEEGLQRYFDFAVSNMPSSAQTLTQKYDYFLSLTTRAEAFDHFDYDFNEDLHEHYYKLEEINLQLADTVTGNTEKTLFLNSLALIHSLYANPHNWDLVGIAEGTSYNDVVEMYRLKAEEYVDEFNNQSFQSFTISVPPSDSSTVERVLQSDNHHEIATQILLDSLCDRERNSPPESVPTSVWRIEFGSDEPTEYAISVEQLELLEGSTLFFGEGTTIQCDNNVIISDFYRNLDYRDATGNRSSDFTFDEATRTITFNSDTYLPQNSTNDHLMRGVRIEGSIYYFMAE